MPQFVQQDKCPNIGHTSQIAHESVGKRYSATPGSHIETTDIDEDISRVCGGWRAGPPFSDPDTLRLPHPCAFGKGGRSSSVTAFPSTRVYAGACPNVSDDVMAAATCIHHLELLSPPSDPGHGPAAQSVSGVARRFRNLERSGGSRETILPTRKKQERDSPAAHPHSHPCKKRKGGAASD